MTDREKPAPEDIVAEKTFLRMRDTASKTPNVQFMAISHSNQSHTTKWLNDIGGTNPSNLDMEVDDKREIYAAWGLGISSFWHVLSPQGLYDVYKLAKEEGIANRPTESGYRWQTSGSWAVDGQGKIVRGKPMSTASEIPDFEDAVQAIQAKGEK